MITTQQPSLPEHADLVVVGAGAAGLYTAYRYLDAHPEATVVVLDRLNRPGGRLQSDIVTFDVDGEEVEVRDEEGGMRFNYQMTELMTLFKKLELCDQIVPFPMGPIQPKASDKKGSGGKKEKTEEEKKVPNYNRYSFRGRNFTAQHAADDPAIWGEIYDLSDDEQDLSPVDLITDAYKTLYRNNRDALIEPLMQATGDRRKKVEKYLTPDAPPQYPTPEYWQVFRIYATHNGTPLYRWQLWGLLTDLGYSPECVTMFAHTLGFEGPFWATTNAGEAIQILEDFPKNPTYFTFEDGFSTLINALVKAIETAPSKKGASDEGDEKGKDKNKQKGQHHDRIFLSTNVDAVERDGDGFRLEVTRAPKYQSSSPTVPGGTKGSITAGQVVLALPRKALTTLFATSPALNRRRSEDAGEQAAAEALGVALQAANNQRLMKINLYYDHAWWQNLRAPVQYGPSFTDLPVNAVYPFYSLRGVDEDRAATVPPNAHLPAALTIYCDWDNTNFWQGLQSASGCFDSPKQREHDEALPQTIFPASTAVVQQATALFQDLFNVPVPQPVLTSFRLWDGEHDFGYAYHQWDLGAKDDDVISLLAQPFENTDLYICNEAYSDMQGWVNGSLRSANLALGKLGIDPLPSGKGDLCSDAWTGTSGAAKATDTASGGGFWGIPGPGTSS